MCCLILGPSSQGLRPEVLGVLWRSLCTTAIRFFILRRGISYVPHFLFLLFPAFCSSLVFFRDFCILRIKHTYHLHYPLAISECLRGNRREYPPPLFLLLLSTLCSGRWGEPCGDPAVRRPSLSLKQGCGLIPSCLRVLGCLR